MKVSQKYDQLKVLSDEELITAEHASRQAVRATAVSGAINLGLTAASITLECLSDDSRDAKIMNAGMAVPALGRDVSGFSEAMAYKNALRAEVQRRELKSKRLGVRGRLGAYGQGAYNALTGGAHDIEDIVSKVEEFQHHK